MRRRWDKSGFIESIRLAETFKIKSISVINYSSLLSILILTTDSSSALNPLATFPKQRPALVKRPLFTSALFEYSRLKNKGRLSNFDTSQHGNMSEPEEGSRTGPFSRVKQQNEIQWQGWIIDFLKVATTPPYFLLF